MPWQAWSSGSDRTVNPSRSTPDKPLLTATMFGVTTPCVETARRVAEQAGYEVLVFHATGTGGMTMESFIHDGLIAGVLDLTTTELADELVGGILSAGKDRLTAAAMRGVPQVIAPGALDMVNFGPTETVPEKFRNRLFLPAQSDGDPDAHHAGGERPAGQGDRPQGQCGPWPDDDSAAACVECPLWIARANRSGGPRRTRPCSRASATG